MSSKRFQISEKKTDKALIKFGDFAFDTEENILFRGAEIVSVPPKTRELLGVFLKNEGRVLTKEDLMNLVWQNTFVEEANLSHHIAVLRKSLGEDKNGKRFIETIPRKGYRFIAQITNLADAETAEITFSERTTRVVEEIEIIDEPENSLLVIEGRDSNVNRVPLLPGRQNSSRNKIFALLAAAILLVGISVYYFGFYRPARIKSVAVLPFKSLTGADEDAYLQIGLADALINKLSSIKKVSFRPTSSVLKFANNSFAPTEAGGELNVDAVLEGRFQRFNERLKVSVQLVKTADGSVIWAESFDENLTDIQRLQDSIAEKITNALALELTGEERKAVARNYTSNPEAYQLYLQGRFQWFKFSPVGWQKAAEYYQQAIDRDPNFAPAYVGLGYAHSAMGFAAPPAENYLKAKEAALKAIELDPNLAEAHSLLGLNKFFYERDTEGARAELLQALKLSPNEPFIRNNYAIFLGFSGKADEAVGEMQKAVEQDPLSAYMVGGLGEVYYLARQPDKAVEKLKKSLELDPNYVYALVLLTKIYEQKGQFAEAQNYRERLLPATGEREAADELRSIYVKQGYPAVLEKRIEQLKKKSAVAYVPPMEIAALAVSLRDKKLTLEFLEKAYAEKSFQLMFLNAEPHWDSLRSDADFQNLLRRINQKVTN